MQDAFSRYYAAFEGGQPSTIQQGGGTRPPASLQTSTGVRDTILALEAVDAIVKEKMRLKGKRIIHSVFDVYLNGREFFYVKEDCSPTDLQARFMLHVFPVDKRDLDFSHPAIRFNEKSCAVIQWLPSYASKRIRTGQYRPDTARRIWSAEVAVE